MPMEWMNEYSWSIVTYFLGFCLKFKECHLMHCHWDRTAVSTTLHWALPHARFPHDLWKTSLKTYFNST
jgi:hypothetical protein